MGSKFALTFYQSLLLKVKFAILKLIDNSKLIFLLFVVFLLSSLKFSLLCWHILCQNWVSIKRYCFFNKATKQHSKIRDERELSSMGLAQPEAAWNREHTKLWFFFLINKNATTKSNQQSSIGFKLDNINLTFLS